MPRPVFVICLDYLFTHLGYFMLIPVLALILTNSLGFSLKEVSLATFIFTLSYRSGKFFTGPLLDGLNPKITVVMGVLLAGFSFIMIGFTKSFLILVFCLILVGLGISANGLAAKSSISYIGSKDGKSLTYFSNINVFVNIAAAIGPLLGTYLLGTDLERFIFQITGTFYILAGVVVMVLLKSTDFSESRIRSLSYWDSYKEVLTDFRFLKFLVFNAIGWFFYAQLFMSLPYFVKNQYHMEEKMGMLFTLNAVLVISLQMVITSLVEKYLPGRKEVYRLLVSFLLFSIAFGIAGFFQSFYVLFMVIVVFTLAEMVFTPSVDTIVSNICKKDLRTTYFSILGLSTALGEGFGNFVGLRLVDFFLKLGVAEWFWISISLFALSASFFLIIVNRHLISRMNQDTSRGAYIEK
jgi:MFS transporter, DHA1 family, multidrug resistance protein